MAIHTNLKKLRKASGLTQQEVAEKLMIKPNTYGAWEANKTYPSAYYLPKLSAIYGISISQLFDTEAEKIIAIPPPV
jgi:transcriptional regulator with XRE-family HTH domain